MTGNEQYAANQLGVAWNITHDQVSEAICSQFDPETHELSECQSAAEAVMLILQKGTKEMTAPSTATFVVTLPGPYAEEWTAEDLRQEIIEAYGLSGQEVVVKRVAVGIAVKQ